MILKTAYYKQLLSIIISFKLTINFSLITKYFLSLKLFYKRVNKNYLKL